MVKQLQKYAPGWLEQLPHLPDRLLENINQSQGYFPTVKNQQHSELVLLRKQLSYQQQRDQQQRWTIALLAAAGIISWQTGYLDLASNQLELHWSSWLLLAGAAVLWLKPAR
jgi:ubiquinone biosynthesis protein